MKATASLVAAAFLAAAAAAAGQGSAGGSAALRLLDRAPVTVRGTQFVPRERVRVTVTADHTMRRTVRATAAGSFTAAFADMNVDRCDAVRVVAVGGSGSRVTLKVLPAPLCRPD